MSKLRATRAQVIAAAIIVVLAVVLGGVGLYGMNARGSENGAQVLENMRLQAILNTAGSGAVDAYVAAAKSEASTKARESGGGMSAVREAAAKAEEEARAKAEELGIGAVDLSEIDTQPMSAAGANPRFAAATGINVDRMRIIGTMLSTMLAAVGIIVYGQSYGFMQLYQAPRQMGFLAASAILIGGATTSRAKISHVVIGTFLFQGVLTLGMPVANALVPQSTISETLRILISNGIILYALTKSGGANRG